MLTQSEVVGFLSKGGLPQNEVYQILHAYVYSKLSRGALPTEAQAKIFSIHRKLIVHATTGRTTTDFGVSSATGRAFEAIKTQLAMVSRKYLSQGVSSFGKLGGIGSASGEAAIKAWTKATDGQVTVFDDGSRDTSIAVDAGRFAAPVELAPPPYVPDTNPVAPDPLPAVTANPDATITPADIERGRLRLAALREENQRKLEELALAEQGTTGTTEERETAQANAQALRT